MNNFERRMRTPETAEKLTDSEREKMRALLSEYAAMRPRRDIAASQGRRSTLSYFTRPAFAFVALVLMIAVGGSGVAYAAEDSLPGG
jgi:hypothetical protein